MGEQTDRRDRPTARGRARRCSDLRDMRGVAYALGARNRSTAARPSRATIVVCPRFEEVKADKLAVRRGDAASSTMNTNPLNATTLVQYHDRQAVVVQPAGAAAQRRRTWTAIYGLPYTRRPHPMYTASRSPPTR